MLKFLKITFYLMSIVGNVLKSFNQNEIFFPINLFAVLQLMYFQIFKSSNLLTSTAASPCGPFRPAGIRTGYSGHTISDFC